MKKINLYIILFFVSLILLVSLVYAQDLEPLREQRLKYGPSLYIENIHTHPEEINPGSDAIISFTMENVAPHQLRDIIMQLELPSQFAPGEISKEKIRTLEGLATIEKNFSIVVLPNSKEGIYKIPFVINYIDEIGNSYTENNTMSIKISAQPKIFTELTSSDIYEGNLMGKVNIKIANKGVGDLKFLVIEMLPSSDYEIIGSSKEYVGALNSDEDETADFKLKVNEARKEINLKIRVDYTDANNKEYAENIDIPLKVISAKEAGIKQNNNNIVILIILGVLIVYLIYRKIRKRTKK
jgi:hypothetical protein